MPEKQQNTQTSQSQANETPQTAAPNVARRATAPNVPSPALRRAQQSPAALTPTDVQDLQSIIGNNAVQRLMQRKGSKPPPAPMPLIIQPKLTVTPVAGEYERAANGVANQVMRPPALPTPPALQRHHNRDEEEQARAPINAPAKSISPRLQRQCDLHGRGCHCSNCRVQRKASEQGARPSLNGATPRLQRTAHGPACSCSRCNRIQRTTPLVARDGSFEAGPDLATRVHKLNGKGSPLPAAIRRRMEPRFGADFTGVRIHTGVEGAQLSRQMGADAFTHGHDIAFARGKFSPTSATGQHLLAHELTHTIQQRGATPLQRKAQSHSSACSCPQCSRVQRKEHRAGPASLTESSAPPHHIAKVSSWRQSPLVQRHSTHEHYLLGTLTPDQLADVPFIRQQVAQARHDGYKQKHLKEEMEKEKEQNQENEKVKEQGKGKEKEKEKGKEQGNERKHDEQTNLNGNPSGVSHSKRREVMHVLEEEMERLLEYKEKGWREQLRDQEKETEEGGRRGQIGIIQKSKGKYQVPFVAIPAKDDKDDVEVICTYGELNTLADMFGTIEDMSNTPAEVIVGMLQGVRQRVYLFLNKVYQEIGGEDHDKKVHRMRPKTSFKETLGFSGKEKPLLGALFAVKGYEKSTKEDGEFTEANATAALARNACHFAPETWYTWRRYHEKARELALQSYLLGFAAQFDSYGEDTAPVEKKARDLANQALLHSGFGDHYLQDAYASGHLIDKTKVMQWFYIWQKKHGKLENTPDYHMIGAIVEQQLKSNPQMMENVRGGLQKKMDEVGVDVKSHINVLMWWRKAAFEDPKKTRIRAREASSGAKIPRKAAVNAMRRLVKLGFATLSKESGHNEYELKQAHIDVLDPKKAAKGKSPYQIHTGSTDVKDFTDETEYEHKRGSHSEVLSDDNSNGYEEEEGEKEKGEKRKGYEKGEKEKVKGEEGEKERPQSPEHDEALEFYYEAYAKFLDKTHLQLITKFLHDKFCQEGLEVQTENGEGIGVIYGDLNMLNAGAQDGVRHSATTAQWARESIYELIQTGQASHSTEEIDARFPRIIKPQWDKADNEDSAPITIDNWWDELKERCMMKGGLFEKGTSNKNFKSTGAKHFVKSAAQGKAMKSLDQIFGETKGPPSHDPVF